MDSQRGYYVNSDVKLKNRIGLFSSELSDKIGLFLGIRHFILGELNDRIGFILFYFLN